MSLNLTKLENIRKLASGMIQARCPACAEVGQDRKGEHLRILPDGRFGCCVHPKDGDHRKRIWAQAGCKLHLPSSPGTFAMRANVSSVLIEARSVKAALTTVNLGTPGTGKSKSENYVPCNPEPEIISLGTLGTPWFNPNVYRKDSLHMCKDIGSGVPSVPTPCDEPALPERHHYRLPFLTADGDLSIPFDSPERYHWWRDGQSVEETHAEVLARMAVSGCSTVGGKWGKSIGLSRN